MDVVERWVRLSYRRPMVTSSAVALLVAVAGAVALRFEQRGGRPGDAAAESAAIVVVAAAFLVVKRTHPGWALAGTAGGAIVYIVSTGWFNAAAVLPVSVCLCSIASRHPARTATLAAVGTCVVLTVAGLVWGGPWLPVERIGLVGWPLLGATIGGLTQARNRYVTAVESRARVAAAIYENETARRVAEERLRISREIHDVVAHQLAALNLQIGVARHLLDRPEHAATVLGGLHETSQDAMHEIKGLVGMLRADADTDGPDRPPGLDDLAGLLDGFRQTGVDVTLTMRGPEREVLPDVGFTVYRVVQEAVTNAAQHAPGQSVEVSVTYRPHTVMVETVNALPVAAAAARRETGFGLIGMAERARATGGRFEAGPTGGRFRVAVELPLPVREAAER